MVVRTVGMIRDPFKANNIVISQEADMVAIARAFYLIQDGYGMQLKFLIMISRFLPNMLEEYK